MCCHHHHHPQTHKNLNIFSSLKNFYARSYLHYYVVWIALYVPLFQSAVHYCCWINLSHRWVADASLIQNYPEELCIKTTE